VINVDEGKYVIQVKAMKSSADDPSAMAPYLSNNCIVTNVSGQYFVTLMILEEQIITGFQLKNKADEYINCIEQHRDEEATTRYEIFQLEQLQTIHHARVQYKVNHEGNAFEGDEELRLFFDVESIQHVDDIDFQS